MAEYFLLQILSPSSSLARPISYVHVNIGSSFTLLKQLYLFTAHFNYYP